MFALEMENNYLYQVNLQCMHTGEFISDVLCILTRNDGDHNEVNVISKVDVSFRRTKQTWSVQKHTRFNRTVYHDLDRLYTLVLFELHVLGN